MKSETVAAGEQRIAPPQSGSTLTFWVVEKFEQDKSAGYFDGGDSFEGFTTNIDVALQFRRKQDAERVISFMFGDLRATEHCYIGAE